jgi:serine/threonine protein kinase
MDASWPTTSPGTHVACGPDKVPVHDALSPGTRLDEFEIVRVLGTGGFGIVYLARDHVLLREVAIKEYMPAVLAGRGAGATISLRSTGHAGTFAKGLESFLQEARLLASFEHRSLVKVHRFWEGNGTAYMAMQYYEGHTLKDVRVRMGAAPGDAWLGDFIDSILGALELLHRRNVFHRDISPDNILILGDGQPVLLDFGSARRVIGDSTQSLTALLKPHFAPLEQYADEAAMPQGAWTDLYALGATLHFVITGRAPTPSVLRAVRDVLPALSSSAGTSFPEIPPRLLAAIDWTLALAPDERPQSVLDLRRALAGELAPPAPSLRHTVVVREAAPEPEEDDEDDEDDDEASAPAGEAPVPAALTRSARESELTQARATPGRGARLGLTASLALLGIAALAWGAWTLNHQSPAVVHEAPLAVDATKATARFAQQLDPAPADAPTPSPDAVALRVMPESSSLSSSVASSAIPLAAEVAGPRSAAPTAVSFTPRRTAPRGHEATPRAKPRTIATSVTVERDPRDACAARGVFGRAMCTLQECRGPHARATPQCAERLRIEEARQHRMERE